MTRSRIKDPGPSARIAEDEIAWLRIVTPITQHYCRQISRQDYRGKKLACWMHIKRNNLPVEDEYGRAETEGTDLPLLRPGAE
jgi:hypothetical protein